MKKLGFIVMPLMAISLLASCGGSAPTPSTTYHVVSFDSDGGSFVEAKQVEDGKTVVPPTDPTRPLYKFDGWKLNGTEYTFTEPVKDDIVLKASWTDGPTPTITHKVTFHFNNDSGSGEQTEVLEVAEGGAIDRPTWEPTFKGYDFINWYQQKTGGSVYTFPGTMGEEDVNIYAHWKITPENYAISYSGINCKAYRSGVSPTSADYSMQFSWRVDTSDDFNIVLVPDTDYHLPESISVLFNGQAGVPGTDYEYKPADKTIAIKKKANALINLTALPDTPVVPTYVVSFNANGGEVTSTNPVTVTEGGRILTAPTLADRPGYDKTAVTWYKEPALTNKFEFGNSGTPVTSNMVLYAKWGDITKYTVHFKSALDESTVSADQTIEYGHVVQRPADPTPKEGYTFTKWYDSRTGGNVYTFDKALTGDQKDITIYARFALKECKITYVTNGGTLGTSHIDKVNYGETITTKPDITRDGYKSEDVEWYTDAELSDKFEFGAAGTGTEVKGDLILYAKWGEIASYTITIKGENVEGASTTFKHGDFSPIYQTVTAKSGYTLVDNYVVVSPSDAASASYSDNNTLKITPNYNVDNISITLKAEKDPEKEYFDVAAIGEKMKYYKDETRTIPLESVKAKRNENFVFYMVADQTENAEGYVPPTSLNVKIDDKQEDESYIIESVEGEYRNIMKKVTITNSYVIGDISISGDAVKKDYYQISFPYLIGLKKPAYEETVFEYTKDVTFEFIAEDSNSSNDDLLTADNVFVQLSEDSEWFKPGEYGSGDNVTFEHDTDNDKYYLHVKANTVIAPINVIKVVARAKAASVLNALSWDEIDEASNNGYATALFDIGDTKTITIGKFDYKVRIIDFNKDRLASSTEESPKYAGITFEFANTIANFSTSWNSKDTIYSTSENFKKSTLYDCFEPNGAVYRMIPPELMKVIKTVDKKYDHYSENEWIVDHYNTQLFPLSDGELCGDETTRYLYYKNTGEDKRKKAPPLGDYVTYWLRSPDKNLHQDACCIISNGRLETWGVHYNSFAVAPAFCI